MTNLPNNGIVYFKSNCIAEELITFLYKHPEVDINAMTWDGTCDENCLKGYIIHLKRK